MSNSNMEDEQERVINNLENDFRKSAICELNWILNNISVKINSASIYDQSCRKISFILGFAEILGFKKVASLLCAAEKIMRHLKKKLSDNKSSEEYLIKISLNAATNILSDEVDLDVETVNIEDLIAECESYINRAAGTAYVSLEKTDIDEHQDRSNQISNKDAKKSHLIDDKALTEVVPRIKQSHYTEFAEEISLTPQLLPLLGDFCVEARDSLDRMSDLLLIMEEGGRSTTNINELFRAIHTIKGGARLLSIKSIEDVAHRIEEMLNEIRNHPILLDDESIDIIIDGTKIIRSMIHEIESTQKISISTISYIERISNKNIGKAPSSNSSIDSQFVEQVDTKSAPVLRDESLYVSTLKLDEMLNASSEVYVNRIRIQTDIDNLSRALKELRQTQAFYFKPATERHFDRIKLNELNSDPRGMKGNLFDSLDIFGDSRNCSVIGVSKEIGFDKRDFNLDFSLRLRKLDLLQKQIHEDVATLERLSERLQSSAMSFRMVPVSQLFNRFPLLIRDMAKKLGKRVKVELVGCDTELDKVLIKLLVDPLIHILRNSLDHGIENESERILAEKSSIGLIRLSAGYDGSYAVIQVEDDGRGIDKQRIANKAIESGLRTADQISKSNYDELFSLIFEPGFSTASTVTEVSGRGVGMDVVKSSVQAMQGTIAIQSEFGKGTKIIIKMPLTLAIIGVVLVQDAGAKFAIPILNIEEVLLLDSTEFQHLNNKMIIHFRGRIIPALYLSDILEIESEHKKSVNYSVIVITDGQQKCGIVVDQALGRQDILIKQYGTLIQKLPYMIGCTILSDNSLVPVLNIVEILNSAPRNNAKTISSGVESLYKARAKYAILIIDDSSLQRKRISTALEQSGYKVVCAEDGFEALAELRRTKYSACVVDLIMPIIDGFEFVERVRAMPMMCELPIYMMSGRKIESEYERRRIEKLNISRFLQKPFDANDLLALIDNSLLSSKCRKGNENFVSSADSEDVVK